MERLLASPAVLLLLTGAALGFNFPFGRIAREAGVPSLVWAALISVGVVAVLGLIHVLRQRPMPLTPPYLRYFAITAVVSFAIPNTLVLMTIPHLGSGLTAIFYTLSPMVTVILSRLAGLRAPKPLEYAGIALGFGGALLVASGRGEIGRPAEWAWVLLGFLIPVSLAAGNVYRSIGWPKGAEGNWLSIGSNVAAALFLAVPILATGAFADIGRIASIPIATAWQIAAASIMFLLYFRLQSVGGPVTLSQIGTVAAGVSILIGTTFFGERYALIVWTGVGVIVCGIALTMWARRATI